MNNPLWHKWVETCYGTSHCQKHHDRPAITVRTCRHHLFHSNAHHNEPRPAAGLGQFRELWLISSLSPDPKSPLSSSVTMRHCTGRTQSARRCCSSLTEGLTKYFETEAPQLQTLIVTQWSCELFPLAVGSNSFWPFVLFERLGGKQRGFCFVLLFHFLSLCMLV